MIDDFEKENAQESIDYFEEQFGESHIFFACHAAIPASFTPELLYKIWKIFNYNNKREYLNIPWTAVSDLILSGLCAKAGFELFKMDEAIRDSLLERMQKDKRFGDKRCSDVAKFLYDYVKQLLNSDKRSIRKFAKSQELTCLVINDPVKAETEFLMQLNEAYKNNNKVKLVQLSSFINSFFDLNIFKGKLDASLLNYSTGLSLWIKNKLMKSAEHFKEIKLDKIGNSNVQILIPEKVKEILTEKGEYNEIQRNSEVDDYLNTLDKETKNKIPTEIIDNGIDAIKKYLNQLNEGITKFYEVNLLIVGEGGAGKTSLVKKIMNPGKDIDDNELTTEGIDICRWMIETSKSKDFRVNFWDFGGQEIYHSTHQFFLTKRSLYILVWDARTDGDSSNFDYWLNVIKLLSDNSPVIIVQNKIDERIKNINAKEYADKFPNIKGFYKASAKTGQGINDIIDKIKLEMDLLPHIGDTLPGVWVDIRGELEELSKNKNYIDYREYENICAKHSQDKDEALNLARYYHDLGVFLNFHDNAILAHTVFLNPQWAANAVYKILDSKQIALNNGRFNYKELYDILPDYPSDKYIQIIELMKKFELCFQIPETHDYIAPELLPAQEPGHGQDSACELCIEYHYDFMPSGIIVRFITINHHLIENDDYWKNGVILKYKNARALVKSSHLDRKISIKITGKDKSSLLFLIRDKIDYIHRTLNNPDVRMMVPCICKECKDSDQPFLFEYEMCKKYLNTGNISITCVKSIEDVDIIELLKGIEKKEPIIIKSSKRFLVAFSFAGEYRDFIKKTAEKLSDKLGKYRVFCDAYYEAELLGVDLDLKLMDIYRNHSELIVLFISKEYEKKDWCGLEWRQIREIIKEKKYVDIMPFRFDDTYLSSFLSTYGYVDAKNMSPEQVGELILKRLELNNKISTSIKEENSIIEEALEDLGLRKHITVDIKHFLIERFCNIYDFDTLCMQLNIKNDFHGESYPDIITSLIVYIERNFTNPVERLYNACMKLKPVWKENINRLFLITSEFNLNSDNKISEIKFSHISKKIGKIKTKEKDYYQWVVFVNEREDVIKTIKSVEYLLSDSFPEPQFITDKREKQFAITARSWGSFTIDININFVNGEEIKTTYFIDIFDEYKTWDDRIILKLGINEKEVEHSEIHKSTLKKTSGWFLEYKTIDNRYLVVSIDKNPFLIGRNEECDLTLPGDDISRQHAEISIKESKIYIRDLNSTNGTYINNKKVVRKSILENGDIINLSNLRFRIFNKRYRADPTAVLTEKNNSKQVASSFVDFYKLSIKEEEILNYILQGKSTKIIADVLYISEGTAKAYLSNMLKKTDTNSRFELLILYDNFIKSHRFNEKETDPDELKKWDFVWESKGLTKTDLNISSNSKTNASYGMTFKKGALKEIDQRHYFRDKVFNELNWQKDSRRQYLERAYAIFEIVINGKSAGSFKLKITHNTDINSSGYKQNNFMTRVHWGDAMSIIKDRSLMGCIIKMYRNRNEKDRFLMIIE